MTKRCYKDAVPVEKAFEIIKEESGSHFDQKLVELFLLYKEKYAKITSLPKGKVH